MNRIFIDNNEFTQCSDDIQNYRESYGFDSETSTVTYGTSDSITLTGEAYKYIVDRFFDDCLSTLNVDVYIECCRQTFTYLVYPGDIEICCTDCTVKIELTSASEDLAKFTCLNSSIAISDDFISSQNHLYYPAQYPLGGIGGGAAGGFTGYLVRDVIKFHAERCNIDLKDNVFDIPSSPFYNLAYVPKGSVDEGTNPTNNVNLLQYNTDTFIEWLTRIVKTANADFYIQNCTLCIDKKENIANDITGLVDLTDAIIEDEICLRKEDINNCAFLKLSYQNDPTLFQLNGKFYADVFQSLTPFTNDESLIGSCQEQIDFAVLPAILLMNDTKELTVDGLFIWDGVNQFNANSGGICQVPTSGANLFVASGVLSTNELAQCQGTFACYEETYRPKRNNCKYTVSGFCFCASDNNKFCEWVSVIKEYGLNTSFKLNVCGREIIVKLAKEEFEIEIDYDLQQICLNDLGISDFN